MRPFLLVLAVATVAATPVFAQTAPPEMGDDEAPKPTLIDRLMEKDTDGDGRLTPEEWKVREQAFTRYDKDKDGAVTREELEQTGAQTLRRDRILRRLSALDQDDDKKVTRDEWKGEAGGFDRYDRNGDGVISRKDFPPEPKRRIERIRKRLDELDENGDGKLSRDEWPGGTKRFKAFDEDGDGSISRKERAARVAKIFQRLAREYETLKKKDAERRAGGDTEPREPKDGGDGGK